MRDDALVRFTAHELPREDLHALMARSDGPALRRAVWHLGMLVLTGTVLWRLRWTVWALPLVVVQGYMLAFIFCALHETAHRTAFRTRWLNPVLGTLAGLLGFWPYRNYRVYHWDHHRFTQDPEADPELYFPKPASMPMYLFVLTGIPNAIRRVGDILRLACGRADRPWMAPSERWPLIIEARAYLTVYLAVAAVSIAAGSPAALVVWIVPWMVGQAFLRPYLLAEHTACAFTRDCLENTRTTLTWPLVKLFAWNMPYHAEHQADRARPARAPARRHTDPHRRRARRSRLRAGVRRRRLRGGGRVRAAAGHAARRRGPDAGRPALGQDVPRRSWDQKGRRRGLRALRARHRALGRHGQGRRPAAGQTVGRRHRPRACLRQRRLGLLLAGRPHRRGEALHGDGLPLLQDEDPPCRPAREPPPRRGREEGGRRRRAAHGGRQPEARRRRRHPPGARARGPRPRLVRGADAGRRPGRLRGGRTRHQDSGRDRREQLHALRVPRPDRARRRALPDARRLPRQRLHGDAAHRRAGRRAPDCSFTSRRPRAAEFVPRGVHRLDARRSLRRAADVRGRRVPRARPAGPRHRAGAGRREEVQARVSYAPA